MVPEPNFCVVPVRILPFLSRSVVIPPLPKGRVVLQEPSERFVMVPEPKSRVVPVRGLLIELLGGVAAKESAEASRTARATASDMRTIVISSSILASSLAIIGFCPCLEYVML